MTALASCALRTPTRPPEILSQAQFVNALRGAGKRVEETNEAGLAVFGVEGYVYRVEESAIHLYAYSSVEERESVSEKISPAGDALFSTPLPWSVEPYIWASGPLLVVYPGKDGGMVLLLEGLLGDPLTRAGVESEAPYPPAVTAAIEWLADSHAVSPESVQVVDFEARAWPDSCLGLPDEGEECAAGEFPGWEIVLELGGKRVRVRADALGEVLRRDPRG
jgi:hypothetical protein